MKASKKSFKADVAARRDVVEDLLSSAQEARAGDAAAPAGTVQSGRCYMRHNVERKTRRVQLTMPPSLFDMARRDADSLGLSFNEYVCLSVQAACTREDPFAAMREEE